MRSSRKQTFMISLRGEMVRDWLSKFQFLYEIQNEDENFTILSYVYGPFPSKLS